ncbi:cation tolerance protein CutA [Neosynechococcus sphagnicola sy1]|uniref:Cation tolerance protein CutA n=1 Tax=Neosynechococcus sphagnicola sy1 TaxID=1497020 RepID=A0A098TML9_9CYAN|nr:divalent-cation tolerance protein CutA [Neosynechococcus sphagnicola]KGF73097.1 cation tolerance protein CutA [Neosynechococcus sphagnicola sy1]
MSQQGSDSSYGVVLVTTSSQAEAVAIAEALIAAKLAACVGMFPIQSLYTWEGTLHHDQEWQLVIKTCLTHFPALEARIRAMHSYEIPEIIALPVVSGSQPYLDWIASQVLASPPN